MGALPLVIMVYTLVFTGRPAGSARSGLPLVQFFSTAGLLLLFRTIQVSAEPAKGSH